MPDLGNAPFQRAAGAIAAQPPARSSIRLELDPARQRTPFVGKLAGLGLGLLGARPDHLDVHGLDLLLLLRRADGCIHGREETLLDLGRHALGRGQEQPEGAVELRIARLGNRGQLGQQRRALPARSRQRRHTPALDLRQRGGRSQKAAIHLASHQVLHGGRRPLVGDVHHLGSGGAQQRLHHQVPGRACAARGIGQVAGLGRIDHVLDGLEAQPGVADQRLREAGRGIQGHQRIALVADVLVDVLVDGDHRVHGPEPGVAVGGRAGGLGRADVAVGAGLVLHDHGLPQYALHGRGNRTDGDIRRPGRRIGHDDAYGLAGPGIGGLRRRPPGAGQQGRDAGDAAGKAAGAAQRKGAGHGLSPRLSFAPL